MPVSFKEKQKAVKASIDSAFLKPETIWQEKCTHCFSENGRII
jgi:hypothetical protein